MTIGLRNLKSISPDLIEQIEAIFSAKKEPYLEKNEIRHLLQPSFIDPVDNPEQCYRLLKLQWLEKQEASNDNELSNLKAVIVQNAHYNFCPIMANEKNKFLIMVSAYERDFLQEIKDLNLAINQIQIDSLTADDIIQLHARLVAILTMKASLYHLGVTVNPNELVLLNAQFDAINELTTRQEALLADYNRQMTTVMSKVADLYQTGHISPSEHNHIQEITKHTGIDLRTSDELNRLADKLETSDNIHRKKLGGQIKLLTHLSEALSDCRQLIVSAFQGTIALLKSMFNFNDDKNSYDLPADSQETLDDRPSIF